MERLLQKNWSLEMNQLHRAVKENRLEAVKYLAKNGADIVSTIKSGQTPLHLAVSLDYHPITQELLMNNSREMIRNAINRRTLDTGTAALHLAVRKNSYQTTQLLLSRGANFEIQDYQHRQPKHQTTDKRILQLIDRIEMIFETTARTSDNQILLEKLNFCSADNAEAVMYARNRQDFTALQFAMDKNQLEAVGTIINFRIDNIKQKKLEPIGEFDKLMRHSKAARRHLSNLDAFCHEDDDDLTVDSFVKKDVVDVLRNAHEFLTAHKENGDLELHDQPLLIIVEESLQFFGSWKKSQFTENKRVDLLLRKGPAFTEKMLQLCIGAPIQFFMREVYSTELIIAVRTNNEKMIAKCLTGHPNMNKRDARDRTALHYAIDRLIDHSNSQIIELLLNFGAGLTSASIQINSTPLHYICNQLLRFSEYQASKILKLLFDRGSFDGINVQSAHDRSTILHSAARNNMGRLVCLLLARGANYCAKDAHDKTPKDYCNPRHDFLKALEYLEIVDRLFAQARDGQIQEVIETMKGLKQNKLLACVGARDYEDHTLDQVIELKGHVDEAKQIREQFKRLVWLVDGF